MRRWCLRAAVGVACVVGMGRAHAAAPQLEAGAPDISEKRYLLGREHYLQGDLEAAAREFQGAYDVFPESAKLAFNLARCYERLAQDEQALRYYDRYLELAPEAEDHGDVARLADGLRRRLHPSPVAPADATKPSAPESTPAPSTPTPDPTARKRGAADFAWSVQADVGFGADLEVTIPVLDGSETHSLASAYGLAVTWDTPVAGALRLGARAAGHTSVFESQGAKADVRVGEIGACLRYGVPVKAVDLFVDAGLGLGVVTFTGDVEGTGFGASGVIGAGVLVPLGRVGVSLALQYVGDTVAKMTVSQTQRNGVISQKVDLDLEDVFLSRPQVTLAVWF